MVKLGTLFQVEKGRSKFDEFIEDKNSNIAYVTTSGVTNGVKCKVLENEHYTLYPEGTITVAMQGTVLASFLQTNPFYLQTHVAALIPKVKMSEELKLFYCYAIKHNADKFSFGRKANSHIENIEIPDLLEAQAFLSSIKKEVSKQREIPYGDNDAVVEYLREIGITMVKLEQLFDIKNGVSVITSDLEVKKGKDMIPCYGASGDYSNTVMGYIEKSNINNEKLFPEEGLYVSTNGAGASTAFISNCEFTCNSDAVYLEPKVEMTFDEKMFYALCITANRYRYSYGRKPKGDRLADLEVPALDELPKWMEEECEILKKYEEMNVKESVIKKEIPLYERSSKDYKGLQLDTSNWQEYNIERVFDLIRGKRITKEFINDNIGEIPVIAGGELNQGILGYLSEGLKNNYVYVDKCLTVSAFGSTGSVLCHNYPCYIDDKAIALKLKEEKFDNVFVMLFLAAVLQQEKFRYTYGRGVLIDRYKMSPIKLPSKLVGGKWKPDYEFMESYIKTLAYSGCLEGAIGK